MWVMGLSFCSSVAKTQLAGCRSGVGCGSLYFQQHGQDTAGNSVSQRRPALGELVQAQSLTVHHHAPTFLVQEKAKVGIRA